MGVDGIHHWHNARIFRHVAAAYSIPRQKRSERPKSISDTLFRLAI